MDISSAIQNRQLISFDYDGLPRVVVPAAYGNHASTGNPILRGYQVRGSSNSRSVPLWDLFLISKMSNVQVLEERFSENPPHYKSGDKHISPILAQL